MSIPFKPVAARTLIEMVRTTECAVQRVYDIMGPQTQRRWVVTENQRAELACLLTDAIARCDVDLTARPANPMRAKMRPTVADAYAAGRVLLPEEDSVSGAGNYVYFTRAQGSAVFKPRYVGKANGKRPVEHLNGHNGEKRLSQHVDKVLREGGELAVVVVSSGLDDGTAFALEIALIAAIGRKPNGKHETTSDVRWPLLNLTDGGDGLSREEARALQADPEVKAKKSAKQKEKWQGTEFRQNISAKHKEKWQDPEFRVKVVDSQSEQWTNPEIRAARNNKNRPYYVNGKLHKSAHSGVLAEFGEAVAEAGTNKIVKARIALNKLYIATGELGARTIFIEGHEIELRKADPDSAHLAIKVPSKTRKDKGKPRGPRKPNGYWSSRTLEQFIELARPYTSRKAFERGNRGAYDAARSKRLIDAISAALGWR